VMGPAGDMASWWWWRWWWLAVHLMRTVLALAPANAVEGGITAAAMQGERVELVGTRRGEEAFRRGQCG